jgi:hypothetical protein
MDGTSWGSYTTKHWKSKNKKRLKSLSENKIKGFKTRLESKKKIE